ncbi:protein PAT1 homolog 1 isoform X1 [Diaphorina citri]|uniref:Protein PAT1 homolog 1 isoform X1 n=1 Tax=Diaphorina citri TaxID=121845 RepID=A0A1S3D5K7_DIACI|nr:protein PAT1 homolog 1 isoform X1 [Diaphorina citri]
MDSLEVEFAGGEEIDENSEYDALNDETFGNVEDTGVDDWEQEHEKFAIIEESFKKFSTAPFEEPVNNVTNVERPERPKLKSLEEIERELMNINAQQRVPPLNHQLNHREPLLFNPPHGHILQQSPLPPNRDMPAQFNHITEPIPVPVPGILRVDPAQVLSSLSVHQNVKSWNNAHIPGKVNHHGNVMGAPHQYGTPVLLPHLPQDEMVRPLQPREHDVHPREQDPRDAYVREQDHYPRDQDSYLREQDEDYDPYAGLMNLRERRWLANIQVMQLEGDDPDYDFYFTEYQKRHGLQHRNSNSDKYNGQMHNMSDSPKMTYVPLQFENSLGKVQVGSVQAPRKVIDRELVSNGTVSPPSGELKSKPRKKLKHILLELEYLYAALQRLDSQTSASVSNESGMKVQRRPAQPPPLEVRSSNELNDYPTDPATLMGYFLKDRDHFLAYMSIRKGKVLGYRLLRLRQDDRFWLMLFQDFRLLVTRDETEEILLTYLPVLRSWLQVRGSWEVLCCILPALLGEEADFALTNKFGMSVIASIIVTAECLYNANSPISKEQHELYVRFVITLVDKAFQHKSELERPVMGIDTKTLESNFYRIESHFFRVHQRIDATKKAIIFNALALPTYQKKKNKMKN